MRPRCRRLLLLLLLSFLVAPATATAQGTESWPPVDPGCLRVAISVPDERAGHEQGDDEGGDKGDDEDGDDPLSPCPGIRPGGALIHRRVENQVERVYCSMGFLVTDGADVYVTTAGHCTLKEFGAPDIGERVAAHGLTGTFGEAVYRWCEGESLTGGCGVGRDFALIRIDRDKLGHASPAMCDWGAAAGIFGGRDETPRELRHFGWGAGVGGAGAGIRTEDQLIQPGNPATQARRSLGRDFSHTRYALGVGPATSGDSGSGVLVVELPDLPSTDQPAPRALGVLTHLGNGSIVVQRLDESLRKAGEDMAKSFSLWGG